MPNPSTSSINPARSPSHGRQTAGAGNSRSRLLDANRNTNLPPQLRWLLDGTARHANVVVRDATQASNARRYFQRVLRDAERQALYLHDMESLGDFEETVKVRNGRLKLTPGPFKQLLDTGGTLILNVANFSPQHLEAFNALLTDGIWQGKKLKRPVRIIFLSDVATLQHHVLSGAQVSRVAFKDLSDMEFPPRPSAPIARPRDRYEADVRIIDLQSEAQWRDLAFGAPELQANGKWDYKPGFSETPAESTLVLRNPPDSIYFEDLVDQLIARGVRVMLEEGIPEGRFRQRIANKRAFDGNVERFNAGSVCNVNASNIDMTLNPHYGVMSAGLTRHPSLLQQASMRLGERELPVVHVCETLPDRHWDRLMMYRLAFETAVSPGVDVPEKYRAHVAMLAGPRGDTGMRIFDHRAISRQPVTFLLSADPDMVDFPPNARHIFITPGMRAETLMCGVQRTRQADRMQPITICEAVAEKTLQPRGFALKEGQLLADLRSGHTVILQGHNPALEDDLATLLHRPHYYKAPDGRLWHFGQEGGLAGRLIVVTQDQERIDRHALTPACSDGIHDRRQWTDAMIRRLTAAFPAHAERGEGNIADLLQRTVCFYNTLTHRRLLPAAVHPVSYRTVAKLFRHLDPSLHVPRGIVTEQTWERIRVMLFKDMLTADHRRSDPGGDEAYCLLKAIFKAVFPTQASAMPAMSVDRQRLAELLERINHPRDILDNPGRFLNVFSPDVIGAIIGLADPLPDSVHMPDDLEYRVLAWLHAQESLVPETLRPLLASAVATRRDEASAFPHARQLHPYQRPAALQPAEKTRHKTAMALRQGGALFAKGPPGSGKSASANRIARSMFRPDIAAINSPAYDDELER